MTGKMSGSNRVAGTTRNFEMALLRGDAKGFAVCAKSLRFARLPDTVATTFAEIDGENRYYVFESEAQANERLAAIPPNEHLGWTFCVREVHCLNPASTNDGPKLDLQGFPFAMRGFLVGASGEVVEWTHSGRLGWRGSEKTASKSIAKTAKSWRDLGRRILSRWRRPIRN